MKEIGLPRRASSAQVHKAPAHGFQQSFVLAHASFLNSDTARGSWEMTEGFFLPVKKKVIRKLNVTFFCEMFQVSMRQMKREGFSLHLSFR